MFNIGVHNQSKLVSDAQLKLWCAAVQTQISRDWAPIYGSDCSITVIPPGAPPQPVFPAYIQDVSDQPGALGYHDVNANGTPFIRVFVKDTQDAGVPVSGVISHEVLEVMGDAYVDSVVLIDSGGGNGTLYAAESADPVEGDLYTINGVQVSNFIRPWWFVQNPPKGASFDFRKKLTAPLTVTPGGYFSFLQISPAKGLGAWQQLNGSRARHWNGSKS